jgi:hypothetical protein
MANSAWLVLAVTAFNLTRAASTLAAAGVAERGRGHGDGRTTAAQLTAERAATTRTEESMTGRATSVGRD